MKKFPVALALVVLLLSACGPAAQRSSVSFIVWGDPAEKRAYEQLVTAFKQQRPDIDVQLTHIPDQGDYRKRLAADFAAGTPADVVLINFRRMPTFAASKAIEPLGPYLSASKKVAETDFYPQALDAFRYDGKLMCIPQNVSSLVVYYNKALFDAAGVAAPQAGWTWDDFLNSAKQLTKDTDGDGTIDQYGAGIEPSFIRVAPFIWQSGGAVVDNEQNPTGLALDTPEARKAIQWFADLQLVHHVVPDAVAEQAEDDESRFQNGRLAMLFDSRRAVPTMREAAKFDWDVASLPQNGTPASILHSDAYCMASASRNRDAAWALIEYANSPDGQKVIAGTGRTVPSLRAIAESPVFLEPSEKPASNKVWLDAVPNLRRTPTMNHWEDVEALLDAEVERVFYGQATLDEAIAAANERAQQFFTK